MIEKSIIINTKFRGIHSWNNCPLERVTFLKNEHHHQFEVQIEIKVTDSDRQFEFIRMQQLIEQIIQNLYPNYNYMYKEDSYDENIKKLFPNQIRHIIPYIAYLKNKSCQMIAQDIINCFNKIYSNDIIVIVSEDGHYSGKVKYIKDGE